MKIKFWYLIHEYWKVKKVTLVLFLLLLADAWMEAQQPVIGMAKDIDGNEYKTVVIGRYEWMAENLRAINYNNGTPVPYEACDSEWKGLESDAYCWYDNDERYSEIYGALYNWYAVNTGNLCPAGWRVPSDDEWKYLEGYVDSIYKVGDTLWNKTGLRGYDTGRRLKASAGWERGGNGTDNYGFAALPAGERLNGFNNIAGSNGYWWTSTEHDTATAWFRSIIYAFDEVSRDTHPKKMGFSVRCIRDR